MLKEKILKKVTQEEIFQYFFPSKISLKDKYLNHLRDDKTPDCFFMYLKGILYFVDFAFNPTHMDCFSYIQNAYGLTFKEVLNLISKKFGLNLHKIENINELFNNNKIIIPELKLEINNYENKERKYTIKVITQAFSSQDLDYWYQYGITLHTLEKFNVKACKEVWINDFLFHSYTNSDPVYRYREKNSFKIYRPFASKKYKWRTNFSGGILECWNELPEKGDLVFVTKSRKDVMSLYEAGFSAIAVKSENSIVSENAAVLLSKRFKNIYSWFDNDMTGIEYSKFQCEKYNWKYMSLYSGFPKDPSDFVKKYSIKELKNIINITLKQ